MAAPTFVQEAETTWNTSRGSKTTGSFSVLAGDVLVAFTMDDDNSTATVVTGGSLTWTRQQVVTVVDYTAPSIWTATVDSDKSMTVNSSLCFGLNVLTFRGSSGVGASSKTNVSSGAPSLGLTTTGDNSIAVACSIDWNAVDGASRTWRTVNSITPTSGNGLERTYFRDAAGYTVYGAYWSDAGTAGSKTLGLSAPGSQKYSIVSVEVLGTSGISGSAAITLGALTTTATGTLAIAGAASQTLGALTLSSTGALAITGSLANTLANLTLSGTGAVLITGALASTLETLALAATGTINEADEILGELAVNLDALTLSGSSVLPLTGQADITLASLVLSGVSDIDLSGSGAVVLAPLGLQATGTLLIKGSSAITLGTLTLEGFGVDPNAAVTLSIIGSRRLYGYVRRGR